MSTGRDRAMTSLWLAAMSFSKASAGGHEEQPWLVNSSITAFTGRDVIADPGSICARNEVAGGTTSTAAIAQIPIVRRVSIKGLNGEWRATLAPTAWPSMVNHHIG